MKYQLVSALAVAMLASGASLAQENVDVYGENAVRCTVENGGSTSVDITGGQLESIDGGNSFNLELGTFDVYCNQPSTLTMRSTNGSLFNNIDLSGVTNNGFNAIPYTLRVESQNSSFDSENFFLPAGAAAGLTGTQGFRQNKSSVFGITNDVVTYTMNVNNDSRTNEQVAAQVTDTDFLYGGTYTETAILEIAPNL